MPTENLKTINYNLTGNEVFENFETEGTALPYDGFSLVYNEAGRLFDGMFTNFYFMSSPNWNGYPRKFNINTLMYGKSYTFPTNCQVSSALNTNYGIQTRKSITGSDLSILNWHKTKQMDPLFNNFHNNDDSSPLPPSGKGIDQMLGMSGKRVWEITFDSLSPSTLMNQNPMTNSLNWTAQDNESADDDDNSLYNNSVSQDFFTLVVQRTNSGQLPMIMQIDKDSYNPDNFVIVKMNENFKISQKHENLYSVKLTLEELI